MIVDTLNYYLAIGGIVLFGTAIVLMYDLYSERLMADWVRRYATMTAFLLTLIGIALTLVYSEVFGFVPCGLCWLQRIALYPQALISGLSLYFKDRTALVYNLGLSVCGLVISLYQHYLQMGGRDVLPCPATGPTADCAERIMFEFHFMTFPLLSACLFLFLIVLYWYALKVSTINFKTF